MNYLSDYIDKSHNELFEKLGAFYAFSTDQFKKQRKEGVKYTGLGSGTIVPTENAKALVEGIKKVLEEGIAKDKKENGDEAIIIRELANHESYYTGEIEDTVDALDMYGYSKEKIRAIYVAQCNKMEDDDPEWGGTKG